MAIDIVQFRAQYPQFDGLDDAVVQARLDEAERHIDAAVFRALFDDAVYAYCKGLLYLSPFGPDRAGRTGKGTDTTTTAFAEYERIRAGVAAGWRVVGTDLVHR